MLVTTVSKAIHLTVLGNDRFLTSHRSRVTSHSPSVRHRSNNFFHVRNVHHYDGIPGAAVEETAVRSLAQALLAPNAEDRIYLDAAKRRMIFIRHPKHAIFHRTIFHTCGGTRATRAALGDHSKFFRFFLAWRGDSLGARLMLQCVGDHPDDASGFGLASHGRIIASLPGICNNHSEVERSFVPRAALCTLCLSRPYRLSSANSDLPRHEVRKCVARFDLFLPFAKCSLH
jgi:hypothetical protein